MNWKYIFNPFLKFSEKHLLIVGVLSVIIGSFIGNSFSVTYDGVFDAHPSATTFMESLKENAINILAVSVLLIILGKIINAKTRIIDIFSISMIYRIPIYISGIFINIPLFNKITNKVLANKDHLENIKFDTMELVSILAASSILMILLIYSITLLVNGFRTATNLKKWQYYIYFAIVLIIAEVLSKILINSL
ncbi:hypothetical protein [Kaistella sp.]|uniref:hypothetical protein n=1 Tax=Kaistella sp. TaxID=2782235 RepID=UPI003C3D59D5